MCFQNPLCLYDKRLVNLRSALVSKGNLHTFPVGLLKGILRNSDIARDVHEALCWQCRDVVCWWVCMGNLLCNSIWKWKREFGRIIIDSGNTHNTCISVVVSSIIIQRSPKLWSVECAQNLFSNIHFTLLSQ